MERVITPNDPPKAITLDGGATGRWNADDHNGSGAFGFEFFRADRDRANCEWTGNEPLALGPEPACPFFLTGRSSAGIIQGEFERSQDDLGGFALARLTGDADSQLLAAFAATAAENFAAARRFHPFQESVDALSLFSARLKCPFHIGRALSHEKCD